MFLCDCNVWFQEIIREHVFLVENLLQNYLFKSKMTKRSHMKQASLMG